MENSGIEKGPVRHGEILQREYRQVFDRYLPSELLTRLDGLRIISVACGFGLELDAVQKIFPTAYIEGIDNNVTIPGARLFNPNIPPNQFRPADATDVGSFGTEPWDLIILRNPQVEDALEVNTHWGKIIGNCVERVAEGGYLFLTTPSDVEMMRILGLLQQSGKLEEVVPAQEITVDFKSKFPLRERFITILQKPYSK